MTTAVISRKDLLARLKDDNDEFAITPQPNAEAVAQGTIDLRVGDLFLSANLSSVGSVDASDLRQGARLFQEARIRPGEHFVMQPRQFVLASTLEYVSLPLDMCGLIQSRSTYGRMGLISATAAYVGPGYKGSPTLELVNAGEVALRIRPYEEICQIVIFTTDEERTQPSRYHCLTKPSFARERVRPDPSDDPTPAIIKASLQQMHKDLRASGMSEARIREMIRSFEGVIPS